MSLIKNPSDKNFVLSFKSDNVYLSVMKEKVTGESGKSVLQVILIWQGNFHIH